MQVYHLVASLGATSLLLSTGRALTCTFVAPNMTSHVLFVLCMLELEVFCFSSLLCVFFLNHKRAGKVKTHTPVLAFLVYGVFFFVQTASSTRNNRQQGSSVIFLFILDIKGSIKWLSFLVGIPFVVVLC